MAAFPGKAGVVARVTSGFFGIALVVSTGTMTGDSSDVWGLFNEPSDSTSVIGNVVSPFGTNWPRLADLRDVVDHPRPTAIPPGPPPAPLSLCVMGRTFCGIAIAPVLEVARVVVAPGRAASPRQPVPSRTRRPMRVWERDAA